MKSKIIISLILGLPFLTYIQSDGAEKEMPQRLNLRHRTEIVKDTTSSQIVYVHIAIDSVKNEREVTYEMLTIGDRFMKYWGYEDYQLDSLFVANPDLSTEFEEYHELCKNYHTFPEELLTDRINRTMTYHGKIFINYYRYTEPVPEIEWELGDETEEILGHECRKATTSWRGMDWTAWFADIPIDAGPWKFQGLPGLILKLENSSGTHYFEAIGTKKDVFPFGYGDHLYSRTTREKFLTEYKDYCENFGRVFADSGMIFDTEENLDKIRNRRKFFAPLELE